MLKNRTRSWRRLALMLLLALGLAGSLAACGKKAPLEPPPNEPDDFGHQYPDPSQE